MTTQYTYSGDGTRLAQTVNGVTTRYVVDVSGQLPHVLEEHRDGHTTRYLYPSTGSGQAAAGVMGVETDGALLYQHADALGSMRQLTDETGSVRQARGYTPFGVPTYALGEPAGSFGFAGEQYDAASGLIFLRARYYDPTTGRFLTRDPYPALAPVPQSLHRYVYCGNDPVNPSTSLRTGRTDPSGQWWWDDVAKRAQQTWRKITRPVRRAEQRVERWGERTERTVGRWRQNPRREAARTVAAAGRTVTDYATRKDAELTTLSRETVSAVEQGDVGGALTGYGKFALAVTGLSDVSRAAQKAGLHRAWLPEGTGFGTRLGTSVGVGFIPVAGDVYDLYAIDVNGNILVSRFENHSDLVRGANVLGAGDMYIDVDGNIRYCYRPHCLNGGWPD